MLTSESENRFNRIQVIFVVAQLLLLLISCCMFYSVPYVLLTSGGPGGGYLATNPNIKIPLVGSMFLYLFTAFPKSASLQNVKRRAAFSLLALGVLAIVFFTLMTGSSGFHKLVDSIIGISDGSGFILFGFGLYLSLVYAITGFKNTGSTSLQKLSALSFLVLYYLAIQFFYLHELTGKQFDYYWEHLGGFG